MIYRVIVTPAGNRMFDYRVADSVVQGRSREPLLDACRQLKRMGANPESRVALCHGVRADQWTLRTTVGKGAELTVDDPPNRGAPRFKPYRPYQA